MNRIVHNLILDMKSTIVQQTIDIQRYDTGRKLVITLSDNGSIHSINEGCYAVFTATKPDGNIIYNHCEIVDNTLVFDLLKNPQVTAAEGEVRCEIRLYGADGSLITSPCFDIVVDKTLYTDDIIESSSEFSALTEAIAANINAVNAANKAVADAEIKVNGAVAEAKTELNAAVVGADRRVTEFTNTAQSEVNGAVAKAEADVAEAVADMRTIVNDSANAFVGSVMGNPVSMADVSPFEHEVKVKVSGDNVDPTTVTLTRCGKNMINPQPILDKGGVLQEDGSIYMANAQAPSGIVVYKANGSTNQVTLSYSYKFASTELYTGTRFEAFYTEGSSESIGAPKQTEYTKVSWTSDPNRTLDYIIISYGTAANSTWWKDVQLELGTEATPYEPFKGATYTPNSDGTVEGVKSLSPNMTLFTDTANAIIECEYNRDSNVVIRELYDRINAAPVARVVNVALPANKWVGSGNLYSQVVNIEGITERSQVDLTPSVEQLSVYYNKDLAFVTENEDGIVTVYSIGQKPTNDYTIQATVTEVNV